MTAISQAQLGSLQAVFGSRVPADGARALQMLENSPLAPADPAALAALRAAVLTAAGQELAQLEIASKQLGTVPVSSTAARAMPAAMKLQLAQLSKARAAQGTGLEKTLSAERARELFDQLASAPDIPHDFVDEGCHFRAHVENKRLEEAGVFSEKIFLVPDGGDLRIDSKHSPIGFTLAMFHTAPCVHVDMPDGSTQRQVLDPSLGEGPMSVEDWSATMRGINGKPCNALYLPRFAIHLMDRDNPPTAWRQQDLDDALAWNGQYKELQQSMVEMGFYDSLKEMAGES